MPRIFNAEISPNNYVNWPKISKVPDNPQALVNVRDIDQDIYPYLLNHTIKKYKYTVFIKTDSNLSTMHNLIIRFDNPNKEPPFEAKMYVSTTKPNESINLLPITIEGIGGDGKMRNCTVYIDYSSTNNLLLDAANQTNQGYFDKAIELIDDAITITPKNSSAWKNKGAVLEMCLKDHLGALSCLNESIKLNPYDKEAWNLKAIALKEIDSISSNEESINCSDTAINLDNGYVWAWDTRGMALKNLRKYDESLQAYNKAIDLNPHYAYIWSNKGQVLLLRSKYDDAIQAFDRANHLDPNDPIAWNNKGIALYKKGEYKESLQAYNTAIGLNNSFGEAWFNKGLSLGRIHRYNESIQAFDRAIQLNPNNPIAWHSKGIVFKLLNYTTKADAAFAKAEDLGFKD